MEGIDNNYIFNTIQSILNRVHVNQQKLKIVEKHDRLSFACPICGDSTKDPYKKRGHLFFNNLYYRCYNEDCRSTFTGLCKKFDIEVDMQLQEKIRNYIDVQLSLYNRKNDEWLINSFDKLIPYDTFIEWTNSIDSPFKSFGKVTFGSSAFMYLKERGFNEQQIETYFYQALKQNQWGVEPYIIFLNIKDNKVIGMQERNLKKGDYRRFKVWTFKDIYERVYKTELDIVESIGYNKLSYLFNIFNVNFNNTVTVFEGYIDSLFYPNSIGAVGANTDLRIFTENDIDIQLFFDNDSKGKDSAYKYIKKGYKVFIWEKFIADQAKKQIDPYKYITWFNDNIKDLNQLILKTNIKWYDLKNYFSSDPVDIMFINYKKQYKQKKELNPHNYEWKI